MIKPVVYRQMEEYMEDIKETMNEEAQDFFGRDPEANEDREKTIEERVDESLDEIRNILAMDGGGIELVEVTEDMVAKVRLMGHCAGCMGARMTMSGIVEQILQSDVPEIKAVEAVD